MSAGFSALAGPVIGGGLPGRIVIGAVAARIAGGKAENGALSAAFEYLFNEVGNLIQRGYAIGANVRQVDDSTTQALMIAYDGSLLNRWTEFLSERYITKGHFNLYAHGNSEGLAAGDQLLSPAEIADTIRANGWTPGQPVTVFGCSFGANGYAPWKVAQSLGVPVTAATEDIRPGIYGIQRALGVGPGWRTFHPNEPVFDWRKY